MSENPVIITYEDFKNNCIRTETNTSEEGKDEMETKTENLYKELVKALKKIDYVDNGKDNQHTARYTIVSKLATIINKIKDFHKIQNFPEKDDLENCPCIYNPYDLNKMRTASIFTKLFYPPPDPLEISIHVPSKDPDKPDTFEDTGEKIKIEYLDSEELSEDEKKVFANYWKWDPKKGYSIKSCNGVKNKSGKNDLYTWVDSEKICVKDYVKKKGMFWGEKQKSTSKVSWLKSQFSENAKKVIQSLRKKIEKNKNTPLCDDCKSFLDNGQTTIQEIREYLKKNKNVCLCKSHLKEYMDDLLQEKKSGKKGGTKRKSKKSRKQNTRKRKTRKIV
jgi:hypothetical protein